MALSENLSTHNVFVQAGFKMICSISSAAFWLYILIHKMEQSTNKDKDGSDVKIKLANILREINPGFLALHNLTGEDIQKSFNAEVPE